MNIGDGAGTRLNGSLGADANEREEVLPGRRIVVNRPAISSSTSNLPMT